MALKGKKTNSKGGKYKTRGISNNGIITSSICWVRTGTSMTAGSGNGSLLVQKHGGSGGSLLEAGTRLGGGHSGHRLNSPADDDDVTVATAARFGDFSPEHFINIIS